jgi:RNA polymerase sigma-70 factor (ECF subfamily)
MMTLHTGSTTIESSVAPGLAEAFMLHRQQLGAFLRARCRGGRESVEIEDLLQELWLRCRKTDIEGISDPKSYLFRAAHNLVIDHSRSASRGRRYEDAWDYMHNRASGGSEPPIAERSLLARERLVQIDVALKAVGSRAAWIFRRYRIEGMQQAAIAAELGVSLSTVEKDLRKAYEAVVAVRELSDGD